MITKFAAVRKGTDDFADQDCWYFNDRKKAENHAAMRQLNGVACDIRQVPVAFVEQRIAAAFGSK